MPLTADIDGTDVTEICQLIRWRPRFNLIDSGVLRAPAHLLTIDEGESELHLKLDGDLVHSGPCWYSSAEGDPDKAYVEVTSWDHRIYLTKRMCKMGSGDVRPGDMIRPGPVLTDNVTAPEILAAFIQNADDIDPGTLSLTIGTVDTGGADVSGVPTDFPMSVERMRSLLVSTGQLDQILTPGIGSSTLDLLNDYDNDLSATVKLEYATGLHNCQIATVTVDMKDVINALWYLLGPRLSEKRWKGSITPTAPHRLGTWPAGLVSRFMGSRTDFGYMQEIRVFDDKGDENSIRPLFEEEWANEAWIRAVPRTFASVRPERGLTPTFRVGDVIGVAAGAILAGGFSGSQFVYGFDLATDTEGVDTIEEIITSADQIGATGAT